MRAILAAFAVVAVTGCSPENEAARTEARLAEAQSLLAQIDAYEAKENWTVDTSTSPITDQKQITLSKYSRFPDDDPNLSGKDRTSGPRLLIRCQSGQPAVVLDPDAYLAVEMADVSMRIDGGAVEKLRLRASQSQDAVGWWDFDSVPIARRLAKAETAAFRVEPYAQLPKDMVFAMADLKEKLPLAADACNWILEPTPEQLAAAEERRLKRIADRQAKAAAPSKPAQGKVAAPDDRACARRGFCSDAELPEGSADPDDTP